MVFTGVKRRKPKGKTRVWGGRREPVSTMWESSGGDMRAVGININGGYQTEGGARVDHLGFLFSTMWRRTQKNKSPRQYTKKEKKWGRKFTN